MASLFLHACTESQATLAALPLREPLNTGAVTLVVATMVPFGYIREYPQPHSHAHSQPAPIQPVAPIFPVTWSLFDGAVFPIPIFPPFPYIQFHILSWLDAAKEIGGLDHSHINILLFPETALELPDCIPANLQIAILLFHDTLLIALNHKPVFHIPLL